MGNLRLGTLLCIEGLAHWGSAYREPTLGSGISMCKHARLNEYLVCIRGQYIKGLLRRWCERLAPLLLSRNLIKTKEIISKVFGPSVLSSVNEAEPTSLPSRTYVGDAYPVKGVKHAKELFKKGVFAYLMDNSDRIVKVSTRLVTRIRIDDVSGKAAEGALYHEVKVPLGIPFYFELVVKDLSNDELLDLARLLLLSLTQLNISSPGRSGTVASVKVVGLKPEDLLQDNVVKEIIRWLK